MTDKAERDKKALAALYAELNKLGHNEEYDRAVKTANKILNISSNEFEAFHYKIICFINLAKFDEAVVLINKNQHFSGNLVFEKAYCYYRANKHEEALKVLQQVEEIDDPQVKELKAQILYRLEKYNEAANLYREIIKNSNDDYEDERQTNLTATLVHIDQSALSGLDGIRENTYELCFNKACVLISHGLYAEAEKKLKQSEKLCRDLLEEEEASEEEIDVDLASIRIQLAYVYQKQGRIKEAQHLYASNLKIKLDDAALVAVASNNVVCINRDQNLFDSKKKMKVAVNDTLTHKLPSLQRKFIALNNAILNYYIHQPQQVEIICKGIDRDYPELATYTTILRALNLIKGDDSSAAISLLEKYTPKNQSDLLFVKLCIVQLYLMKGDKFQACKILENLGDDCFKPGIVGALTTLYLGLGDEEKALKIFEKCVNFYKANKTKEVDLTSMWRQAADFHIRNGHPQVAATSLEELLKTNKKDKKIIAQLVLACLQFDQQKAFKLSGQLPGVKEMARDVDVESLQAVSSTVFSMKKSPAATKQESQPATPKVDNGEKQRQKKKRKGKLPKNYIAGVNPDPERWLPRYERSGFRKKRDRRAKDVIKGSQGTASGQAEQFDFSSKVVEECDSPTVEPSPRAIKGQQQKKPQNKKKNKRR